MAAGQRLNRFAQVRAPFSVGGRWLAVLAGGGAGPGHEPGPVGAHGRQHAVASRQVRAGLEHQRGEPRNEVLGVENHVRGAGAIRRLECLAHVPARGQRQPRGGDRRPCDVARQALEIVPLRGLRRDVGVQGKA